MYYQPEAKVLRHEACPICRRTGRDRHGDNLAVYDDGHVHCFACGYHPRDYGHNSTPNIAYLAKRLYQYTPTPRAVLDGLGELTYALPSKAQEWLDKYGITRLEQIQHGIQWSEDKQYLILPITDEHGQLIGTNSRYFGDNPNHPKYVNSNVKHGYFKVVQPGRDGIPLLVLVEDILSSIKVGRHAGALALCGTHCPDDLFLRCLSFVGSQHLGGVAVWLDPDKHSHAASLAKRFSQYLPSTPIWSEKDPKEHTDKQIIDLLSRAAEVLPGGQSQLAATAAGSQ